MTSRLHSQHYCQFCHGLQEYIATHLLSPHIHATKIIYFINITSNKIFNYSSMCPDRRRSDPRNRDWELEKYKKKVARLCSDNRTNFHKYTKYKKLGRF